MDAARIEEEGGLGELLLVALEGELVLVAWLEAEPLVLPK